MPSNPTPDDDVDLFRQRLENIVSQRHELYRSVDLIKWSRFEEAFDSLYSAQAGCPGRPIRLMVGFQYLEHLLPQALEQVRRLTGAVVEEAYVGRGYRGHQEQQPKVHISRQRRGVRTNRVKKCMKRRQAIEPVTGRLKQDRLLSRNFLFGCAGGERNVLLCCVSHHLRLGLRRLEVFVPASGRRFGACESPRQPAPSLESAFFKGGPLARSV